MNCTMIYDILSDRGAQVVLANPIKTMAIAEARIKTDKVDSEILARLLASDFVCQAYVPPRELREVRAILRHRAGLKKQMVAIKNHVHAALARHAISIPVSDLFGKRGRELILKLDCLPQTEKVVLASNLKMLDALESEVKSIQKHLDLYAMTMKESDALLSIPGIDSLAALTIISEIGDIRRFPSPKKLSSYAGLAPSVHQSGKARYTGHITKAGRSMLRWIMVQAAQHAVRSPGPLRDFYLRLKHKKGNRGVSKKAPHGDLVHADKGHRL